MKECDHIVSTAKYNTTKEDQHMELRFPFQLLAIIASVMFPALLVKAIKAEEKDTVTKYTTLVSVCMGYIVFVLIASIN